MGKSKVGPGRNLDTHSRTQPGSQDRREKAVKTSKPSSGDLLDGVVNTRAGAHPTAARRPTGCVESVCGSRRESGQRCNRATFSLVFKTILSECLKSLGKYYAVDKAGMLASNRTLCFGAGLIKFLSNLTLGELCVRAGVLEKKHTYNMQTNTGTCNIHFLNATVQNKKKHRKEVKHAQLAGRGCVE